MISYDLGGNDGRFNVFLGQGGEIQRLAGKPICPFWTSLLCLLHAPADVAGKFFKMTHKLLCGDGVRMNLPWTMVGMSS